jgi:DNA-directed RNA polymerase subunit M/transcription elongation factor TFIIS
MSTSKCDSQQVLASKGGPKLTTSEAHQDTHAVALIEVNPQRLKRNIQPLKSKIEKQKQPLTFCPTCQMLLRTTLNQPTSLRCKKCGYKKELHSNIVVNAKQVYHQNEIAVLGKAEEHLRTYPIVQVICEKCGKKESETWSVAVGSEGAISAWIFLRCTSCGFTRREVG